VKTCLKNLSLLPVVLTGLALMTAGPATAQTFTVLHSFADDGGDGADPESRLVLSSNTLYGTTRRGGSSGNGTVFSISTDGTGFTNLHNFTEGTGLFPNITNNDGAYPFAGLTLSGDTLYGTTYSGGDSGNGTVFALNTDGTGFINLHNFTGTDGTSPMGGLRVSGNTLYGTARFGGTGGHGTVFRLSFPPQLSISPSGPNIILTWPTNVAGFDYSGYTLQSTTNLAPPVWTTNSPPPVVINGLNTATNPISGTQQFFRLSQ